MGCSGLTSIYIPQNVSQIGIGAFEGCSGVMSIEVDAQNTTYDSRENCNAIIETALNKMILCGKNSTIPTSVKELGDDLFKGRTDIENLFLLELASAQVRDVYTDYIAEDGIISDNDVQLFDDSAFDDGDEIVESDTLSAASLF